jgi:hypothetical protein
MRISAKLLLLLGNAALGVVLLSSHPREAAGDVWPKTGCCRYDTSGNGVCCIDCCPAADGCKSSAACPKRSKT